MYDNVRSKDYNPQNCRHLACSEIRAANLAGYCEGEYSYVNAFTNTAWNQKRNVDCVKSKANEHMMTYYDHCSKDSIKYVNEVWSKCYIDKSPIKDFSKQRNFI
jgi:inner membrane protease ATP23